MVAGSSEDDEVSFLLTKFVDQIILVPSLASYTSSIENNTVDIIGCIFYPFAWPKIAQSWSLCL